MSDYLQDIVPADPLKYGAANFTGDSSTATEGFRDFYNFKETGAERTFIISSADIAKGTPTIPWCPEIADHGGDCGSFNLIIDSEGGELFDGAAGPITITVDRGRALLQIDGTAIFTR